MSLSKLSCENKKYHFERKSEWWHEIMKKIAFQTKIDHAGSETGNNLSSTLNVRWLAVKFALKVSPKNIKSVLLYKY